MKKLLLILLSLPLLTCAEEPGQWVDLFNGKNLDGWIQRGGEAKYTVEDGVIVGTTVPKTPNSFLCTEKNYSNFILEVEFKVDPTLNCGVQIRSNSLPDYKNGQVHGYQVEIDPADRGWSGGIYDEGRRGWLDDHSDNPAARYAFRQNDWNKYRIEAIGSRIRTFINGVPAADLSDDMTPSGFIALQVHGIGNRDEALEVLYRHVRIQDLGDKPDYRTPDTKPYTHEGPLVKEGAEFRKLAEGFKFTEGPALSPDGKIYFSDIPNERIHIYDPATKETTVFREQSGKSNGLFFTPAGALIACEGGNRRVTRTDFAGKITVIAEKFEGKKLNSPNDVVPDGTGGFYISDPRYGKGDDREIDVEAVYYLDKGGKLTQVAADLVKPNGVIMSPDSRILYIADPGAEKIFAYDVETPGKPTNKRELAPVGSDGMTVDKLGNVYVTWKEQIIAFSPEGKEVLRLTVPEGPANCLLVGKTLYATAKTGFYAIDLEVEGVR
ncbi:MAG: family 16 glycoside hydrolase [Verrucomicrobiales bacterium]